MGNGTARVGASTGRAGAPPAALRPPERARPAELRAVRAEPGSPRRTEDESAGGAERREGGETARAAVPAALLLGRLRGTAGPDRCQRRTRREGSGAEPPATGTGLRRAQSGRRGPAPLLELGKRDGNPKPRGEPTETRTRPPPPPNPQEEEIKTDRTSPGPEQLPRPKPEGTNSAEREQNPPSGPARDSHKLFTPPEGGAAPGPAAQRERGRAAGPHRPAPHRPAPPAEPRRAPHRAAAHAARAGLHVLCRSGCALTPGPPPPPPGPLHGQRRGRAAAAAAPGPQSGCGRSPPAAAGPAARGRGAPKSLRAAAVTDAETEFPLFPRRQELGPGPPPPARPPAPGCHRRGPAAARRSCVRRGRGRPLSRSARGSSRADRRPPAARPGAPLPLPRPGHCGAVRSDVLGRESAKRGAEPGAERSGRRWQPLVPPRHRPRCVRALLTHALGNRKRRCGVPVPAGAAFRAGERSGKLKSGDARDPPPPAGTARPVSVPPAA